MKNLLFSIRYIFVSINVINKPIFKSKEDIHINSLWLFIYLHYILSVKKVPKPEDLGVFLENEDIRMIRWVGGETTALNQMQNRLAVEYDTFLR